MKKTSTKPRLVIRSEILMAASRDEWEVQLKDIMKPILKLDKGSTVDQALDVFLSLATIRSRPR